MDPLLNPNTAGHEQAHEEEEEEEEEDDQQENTPPPPARVYMVDAGGNGQEVLTHMDDGDGGGGAEQEEQDQEEGEGDAAVISGGVVGGGGRDEEEEEEGDGKEGGRWRAEDDEEEEEEGEGRWRTEDDELDCNEDSDSRRDPALGSAEGGRLEGEGEEEEQEVDYVSQDDGDEEEDDEVNALNDQSVRSNDHRRQSVRSNNNNDHRHHRHRQGLEGNGDEEEEEEADDAIAGDRVVGDDYPNDEPEDPKSDENNDENGVVGRRAVEDEEEEEEDSEDDADSLSGETGHVQGGGGRERWYSSQQGVRHDQHAAQRGRNGAIGRNSNINHVPGPPRPETLDFVGENRIVFVGQFQVRVGNQWIGENTTKRLYSQKVVDKKGWIWRLMLMPDGNSPEASGCLSVFVEHVNKDEIRMQEPGFSRFVRLGFALLPTDPSRIKTSDTLSKLALRHSFQYKYADFGYPRCWQRSQVLIPHECCYLDRNGFIRISTFIEDIPDVKIPANHNSKKETGMVGLKNQGATCYMNSLLQTLFHVLCLRKAVYDMPTDGDNSGRNVALALQRVFYRLQTADKSVGTKELTKSFGWDAYDSFTQQDVQELNRVLCDHLEDKMKGTPVEGTIQRLFEGSIRSYIKCVNVDFTSAREETYYDIQLDVKGCKDIGESFAKYVEEEMLDGENKYDAGEEHGRQDAKKGVRFLRFPPVLTIHLKRFEYDMSTGNMIKVNDRFAFPRQMDIDEFLGEEAERDVNRPNSYILHSVLVHSGDVHGGHYFAYIRPDGRVKGGQWCKFNDEVVTQVDESEAIEGSYGAGPDSIEEKFRDPYTFFPRDADNASLRASGIGETTSAYMLVYVRECDLPKTMMLNANGETNSGIPQRLRERFQKEEEEQQRRLIEKNEAHLYFTLRVAQDKDLDAVRTSPYEDFVKWDETLKVKVKKKASAEEIVRVVAREMDNGRRPDRIRLWICCSRENKTYRPEGAIQGPWDGTITIEQILHEATPRMINGVECYNIFADEVGKYEVVKPKVKVEIGLEDSKEGTRRGKVGDAAAVAAATATATEQPLSSVSEGSAAAEDVTAGVKKAKLESAAGRGADGGGGDGDSRVAAIRDNEGEGQGVVVKREGGKEMEMEDMDPVAAEDAMVERVRKGEAYESIRGHHVLCFFKMYDPDAQPQPTLKYVGHSLLKGDDSSALLASEAIRLAGLPPGIPLDLYEQVTPRIINELPQDKTLIENELQHGDIVLFQRTPPPPPVLAMVDTKIETKTEIETGDTRAVVEQGEEKEEAKGGEEARGVTRVKQESEAATAGGGGADGAGAAGTLGGPEEDGEERGRGRKRDRAGEGTADGGREERAGAGSDDVKPPANIASQNGAAAAVAAAADASPIVGVAVVDPPAKRSRSDSSNGDHRIGTGAGAGAGGGGALDVEMETEEPEEDTEWTGLAGAKRILVERVWRVPGVQATVKKFFEHKSTKRVVHFLGRSDRDKVFIPEGSATQDGRSPGLSVEMPRSASHREILETLCQRLDSVRDPLLLRVSPMTAGGKPQGFAEKVHLSDLDLPQYSLHRVLEVSGAASHGNTLLFELLPFPLDKVTHGVTMVEAFSSDAILKAHCLARMAEQPVMVLARKRTQARRDRVLAAAVVASAAKGKGGEEGGIETSKRGGAGGGQEKGQGESKGGGKKRKLGEGAVGDTHEEDAAAPTMNGHKGDPTVTSAAAAAAAAATMMTVSTASGGGTQQQPSIEEIVLRPPAPDDLIATYVLVKGKCTMLDVIRQLAEGLRLPRGSEHRLRLLGIGSGEINSIIDRDDDAQRLFNTRATQHFCGPVIREPSHGAMVLEMADDEERAATCAWGRMQPPMGEPAPVPWMPLQVVMFTVNPNGQWAILHGNPLITYVKANDEVEDVILRFGRRRGQEALDAAGLRRGRPAVVDNFRPLYLDEEREKERALGHHGLLSPPSALDDLPPPPPLPPGASAATVGEDCDDPVAVATAALGVVRQNGFLGNGDVGGGATLQQQQLVGEGGGAQPTLLWRILRDRFPQYVNKGLEDEPMQAGKFPILGFKKDNPNEQKSYFRRAEQGIRIRGS